VREGGRERERKGRRAEKEGRKERKKEGEGKGREGKGKKGEEREEGREERGRGGEEEKEVSWSSGLEVKPPTATFLPPSAFISPRSKNKIPLGCRNLLRPSEEKYGIHPRKSQINNDNEMVLPCR
jgi:hypothetical protein